MDNIDHNNEISEVVSPDVVQFFYQSFKYSQGSSSLQKCLYEYAYTIQAFKEGIREDIPESLLAKLAPPAHHKLKDSGTNEFRNEWVVMALTLSGVNSLTMEPIKPVGFEILVDLMLDRDKKFQNDSRKLKTKTLSPQPDTDQDPHASFIRRYAILGESTKNPIFDKLFSDVKENILTRKSSDKGLSELRIAWERKHPGFKFFLEK